MRPQYLLNNSNAKLINFGQLVLTVLLIVFALSYTLGFFLSSYLQINLTESLIYHANDGWCDPQFQGLGTHCFGDFYAFMQFGFDDPWRQSPTAYPPLSLIFFKSIKFVYLFFNSTNAVLIFYLIVLSFALVFPVLHLYFTKRIKSLSICLVMGSLLFALAPTIMVIDRGNNIGFAIPFIYLCFLYLINNQDKAYLIASTLLCLWKPQFGIFSFAYIYSRKYKWFFSWIIVTAIGYLASFSIFGFRDVFSNSRYFLKNLFGYQSYISLPSYFPSNWSFANSISVVMDLPRLFAAYPSIALETVPNLSGSAITKTSLLFLTLSLVVIYLRSKTYNPSEVFILLCLVSILTPSVTFSYYLSVLIPVSVLISYGFINERNQTKLKLTSEDVEIRKLLSNLFATRYSRIMFIVVISTCFVSWPFTWQYVGVSSTTPASKIGMQWTFGLLLINAWYLSLLFRQKRVETIC